MSFKKNEYRKISFLIPGKAVRPVSKVKPVPNRLNSPNEKHNIVQFFGFKQKNTSLMLR